MIVGLFCADIAFRANQHYVRNNTYLNVHSIMGSLLEMNVGLYLAMEDNAFINSTNTFNGAIRVRQAMFPTIKNTTFKNS